MLTAGVYRTLINPAQGTYLAGYGHPFRGCRSVRDDLTATALVLDDGATRLALVAVDQLAIAEDVADLIRQQVAASVPADHVLIACSHGHCTPVASAPADQARAPQRRYVEERFVPRVVEALTRAAGDLRPAELYAGAGEIDIAVHRRATDAKGRPVIGAVPDGAVDRFAGALQVRGAEGGPTLVTVVNATAHPTILGPKFKIATAGWPGEMRRVIEATTGAPALFLQGATGDVNPDHEWGRGELEALARIGRRAGEQICATLDQLAPLPGTPLGVRREPVHLDLVPELHRRTGAPLTYQQALQRQIKVPRAVVDWLMRRCYPWRNRLERRPDGGWRVPLELQVLRLGDAAIVAQGAEVFQGIGQAVKQASPATLTLFAGYANGMIGYLPTREEHARGGYEVDMAPYFYRLPGRLDPDSAERAVAASGALLESLWAA